MRRGVIHALDAVGNSAVEIILGRRRIKTDGPREIDYSQPVDNILDQVMDAIEQSKKYMFKGRLTHLLDK